MSVPVDVAQENGILLFRFDSVSDVVVPDNLPVSINITLTYNSITSFTIPQFIVANPSVGKATEIDFECAFNLPSPSLVRRPPQLDIILRVAPIINASDTSLRIQQTPLIAQGSRSIALPALFRAKPAAPVQVRKKPTLPLGGISTRGVLIPNVRAFAMEADGECREAIWVADFGAACGGVKAKFCVKGIGIVETITKGKKVRSLPYA
ncbi:hypothetical protein BC830DRAFT_1112745 [Chytriomyces sp. MP71]|nr:hypothetical protein BC830DRAFT_1112745 [Chytriomyces sp. MP71]